MGNLTLTNNSNSGIAIGQVSRLLSGNAMLHSPSPIAAAPIWRPDIFQTPAHRTGIPVLQGLLMAPNQLRNWGRTPTPAPAVNVSHPVQPSLPALPAQKPETESDGEMEDAPANSLLPRLQLANLDNSRPATMPAGIHDTGLKDKYGRPIRLTQEAAAGLFKILALAKGKGIRVEVISSYRSVKHQQELWNKALKKYGSAARARRWVAPPGHSYHNFGQAIDVHMYRNGRKIPQKEFDQIIAQAGMYRPMSWEDWHIEPLSTRHSRGR